MSVVIRCPSCRESITLTEESFGAIHICEHCKHSLMIPSREMLMRNYLRGQPGAEPVAQRQRVVRPKGAA